jgi:glycerol kinase (EC 2.7.1.30)
MAILAIDQGTTSSRVLVYGRDGGELGAASRELPQSYPHPGWVEHDAGRIRDDVIACAREALARAQVEPGKLAAIGITNQRETVVLWDRATGQPLAPAIVWQDRRTAERCRELARTPLREHIEAHTGLLLDPYFSATKLAWLLDQVPAARERAARGELAFGTIDSWLIWCLTGGRRHVTDATNACRTALYDIHRQCWCPQICEALGIDASLLPEVLDSAAEFGDTDPAVLGAAVPIRAVLGDQQAATVGQACFEKGMTKSTYGTGCFVVLNTGATPVRSRSRLLTTIAYRLNGEVTYALEGSIFIAGAAVQWLRDALGVIEQAPESEALAASVRDDHGVYLVPAFTGLGAPWWDPDARGGIFGLTRDAGAAHITRAALESVAYQTRDLLTAMAADAPPPTELRIDGGMAANDWVAQFLPTSCVCRWCARAASRLPFSAPRTSPGCKPESMPASTRSAHAGRPTRASSRPCPRRVPMPCTPAGYAPSSACAANTPSRVVKT